MADLDREKWNRKYDAPGYRRGDGPPALIRGAAAALPRSGRAVDIACGEGQVAVWLARRGLEVVGIDIADAGIAKAGELAVSAGVTERTAFLVHDLDDGLPPLDGPLDVVTCIHFHAPDLIPAARELLAPGGVLVVETLTTENVDLGLPAPSERYLAEPGEVLRYADGLRVRLYREALVDGTVRAQLVAQKQPGPPPGFAVDAA